MPPVSTTIQTLEQVGEQLLTNMSGIVSKTLISIVVIVVLLYVRKVLNRVILKNNLTSSNAYFWHKIVGYSITGLMVLIVGPSGSTAFRILLLFWGCLSQG